MTVDSNDITECQHADRPSVGTFGCSEFIFHKLITFVRNITKQNFVLRMLFLNFYSFKCNMLLYVFFLLMWLVPVIRIINSLSLVYQSTTWYCHCAVITTCQCVSEYFLNGFWFSRLFVYSSVICLCSMYVSLVCVFVSASPGSPFVFSVLAKRLAGKSVSKMTYFVLSGT